MIRRERVYVGLSGGVDSSVAALRLCKEGYDVTGVFIKVWQPEFLTCNWEEERLDAMRVAAKLQIPFKTFDAQDVYKHEVADYMISEYTAGRTPNPDIMCNTYVKFGAFLDYAKREGASKVATGHYAQIKKADTGSELHRGVDNNKDQSYFLWNIARTSLPDILFPVGNSTKAQIRSEAENASLITARKSDSQGICFLGHVDIKEFLRHFITLEEGDVLDQKGAVIGVHHGALIYTLGQRHGFETNTGNGDRLPQYVVARDIERNTITVSEKRRSVTGNTLYVHSLNILSGDLDGVANLEAQFRYRQTPFPIRFTKHDERCGIVDVLAEIDMPSDGQSCVFYKGTRCLGGGIITTSPC